MVQRAAGILTLRCRAKRKETREGCTTGKQNKTTKEDKCSGAAHLVLEPRPGTRASWGLSKGDAVLDRANVTDNTSKTKQCKFDKCTPQG